MKGMNLSGKPGIVHPMQMPPTFGQPPIPPIQPRFPSIWGRSASIRFFAPRHHAVLLSNLH